MPIVRHGSIRLEQEQDDIVFSPSYCHKAATKGTATSLFFVHGSQTTIMHL